MNCSIHIWNDIYIYNIRYDMDIISDIDIDIDMDVDCRYIYLCYIYSKLIFTSRHRSEVERHQNTERTSIVETHAVFRRLLRLPKLC